MSKYIVDEISDLIDEYVDQSYELGVTDERNRIVDLLKEHSAALKINGWVEGSNLITIMATMIMVDSDKTTVSQPTKHRFVESDNVVEGVCASAECRDIPCYGCADYVCAVCGLGEEEHDET